VTLSAPATFSIANWAEAADDGRVLRTLHAYLLRQVLAALLITNLGLGVLTRAAPQLNIFAVGFPLTILIGLLGLTLLLPYFAPALERMFVDGLAAMLQLAAALR